jgi:hypothetical protein
MSRSTVTEMGEMVDEDKRVGLAADADRQCTERVPLTTTKA